MNMIHRFMGCIREYKKPTILTLLCMVGEVAIEVLIPFFTANLVNEIKGGAELSGVVRVGLGLILMSLVSLGCGALGGLYGSRASAGFAKNVRHDVFTRVQSFAFENIDKFSSASLVTRMTTDINNVQMSFMMCIRIAVRAPLMFLFAIIMAYIMGGALATTFLIIIPLLVIGLLLIARKAMPAFRAVFRKYDKLNESVEENVRAMRVVKGFAREGYEKQKFAAASHDIAKDFTFAERVVALNAPLMQFCVYFNMIFVLFVGSRIIITNGGTTIDVGQLSAMLTYGMQILMSLMMISMIYVMMTMSYESFVRICEVLEEEPALTDPASPAMDVKDGSIAVDGSDIRTVTRQSLRHQYGMVLQDTWLKFGTVRENIRLAKPDAADEEVETAAKKAHADSFIRRLPNGYDTMLSDTGGALSAGQRQLLCIARVMLCLPPMLILDEATSSIDTRTEVKIQQAFDEMMQGRTSFVVAHRLSTIREADVILVMRDGRIVEQGKHDELLARNGFYAKLYHSQFEG